jgi:hypothetical protein
MARNTPFQQAMRRLRRGIQMVAAEAGAGRSSRSNTAIRRNVVTAVNTGRAGSHVEASAVQDAPIRQNREGL